MSLSEIWTLESDDSDPSDEATLSAWGFESAVLSFSNQAADVLTLSGGVADAATPADLWEWESPLTLYRDGEVFFRGRVATTPRSSDAASARVSYEVRNIWWELERITLTQEWASWTGSTTAPVKMARQVLGYDGATGARQSTREVLTALAAAATALGSSVSVDVSALPVLLMPMIPVQNITIARAMREVLRWHPDAVFFASYSASGTVLRAARRSSAGAVLYDANGRPASSYDLRSLPELVPDAVHLSYETQVSETVLVDDEDEPGGAPQITRTRRLTVAEDVWPAESVRTRKTLVATLPGTGPSELRDPEDLVDAERELVYRQGSVKTHAQPIGTRALPRSGAVDNEAEQWWLDHSGLAKLGLEVTDIKLPTATTAEVQAHSIAIVESALPEPPSAVNPESTPLYRAASIDDLPRELVSGQVADWMGVLATPVMAEVTMGIRKTTVDALPEKARDVILKIGGARQGLVNGVAAYLLDAQCEVMGTDARTKVYQRPVSVNPGSVTSAGEAQAESEEAVALAQSNAVIPGLARRIFESRSELQHAGSWTLVQREAGARRHLGSVLNLSHADRAEWGSMRAQIQQERLSLGSGQTMLRLGPAGHLSPQDWLELMGAMRATQVAQATSAGASQDAEDGEIRHSGWNFSSGRESDENPVVGSSIGPRRSFSWRPNNQSRKFGFEVYRASTTGVAVAPSIVSGLGVVAKSPNVGGSAITGDPAPEISLSASTASWIAMRVEVLPETEEIEEDLYGIKEGGGLMVGTPNILAYVSEAAMESASQAPVIDTDDGTVDTNGIYIIPLAYQNGSGVISQSGFYGPIGLKMCASGALQVTAPIYATATVAASS
jgi:hypothetical protein